MGLGYLILTAALAVALAQVWRVTEQNEEAIKRLESVEVSQLELSETRRQDLAWADFQNCVADEYQNATMSALIREIIAASDDPEGSLMFFEPTLIRLRPRDCFELPSVQRFGLPPDLPRSG